MTEAEWLKCRDSQVMLEFVLAQAKIRKLRLFGVACCRRLWSLLTDVRSQRAVEFAEADDGTGSLVELERVEFPIIEHLESDYTEENTNSPKRLAAELAAETVCTVSIHDGKPLVALAMSVLPGEETAKQKILVNFFHDIFGPLAFRPVTIDSSWLSWENGTILCLAKAIYDEGAFDRLPILGDALEDAGCEDQDILQHCRAVTDHVRGCWVVDLLLGKK